MDDKDKLKEAFHEAMQTFFKEGVAAGRYVDVSRIPLICQNISTIHADIGEIKQKLETKYVTQESFFPVKSLVYGLVGIILTAVIGGFVMLLIK